MAPSETKSKKLKTGEHLATRRRGVFSSLPDDIIHNHILSRLPVRDAVRTSVLSQAWRLQWRRATALIFEESTFLSRRVLMYFAANLVAEGLGLLSGVSREEALQSDAFKEAMRRCLRENAGNICLVVASSILIHVMKQHNGPLEVFQLSLPTPCPLYLPASLRGYDGGFKQLAVLTLKHVVAAAEDLSRLIYSCPSLARLMLYIGDVNVDAPESPSSTLVVLGPQLRYLQLHLNGLYWYISLDTPKLASALINHRLRGLGNQVALPDGRGNLMDLLNQPSQLERLAITSHSMQFLCFGAIPIRLQQPLNHLERVVLSMSLESPIQAHGALCLFRSTPTLKILYIFHIPVFGPNHQAAPADIWESTGAHCSFPRLEHLKIFVLNRAESEVSFMRFVIRKAPVLAKIDIAKQKCCRSCSLQQRE